MVEITPADPATTAPTPEQIESYRRDGFLIVERFLDPARLARVR